eukprot:gene19469-26129_t
MASLIFGEWDQDAMPASLAIHDRALRRTLTTHYSYEVTTEGDAFINAFHEPLDAVAWCLATQVQLFNAAWPPKLLEHSKAMPVPPWLCNTVPTIPGNSLAQSINHSTDGQDMGGEFIRNSILSGMSRLRFSNSKKSMNPSASGSIMHQAQPVVCAYVWVWPQVNVKPLESIKLPGGQNTGGGVYRQAAAISDLPAGGQVLTDNATFQGINGDLALLKSILRKNGHVVEGELDGSTLDDPPLAKVWDGATANRSFSGVTQFFRDYFSEHDEKNQVDHQNTVAMKASQGGCMVINCGIFDLATGCESLIQVMPPGLERRALFFPPLEASLHLTPGYFDAPGTFAVRQSGGPPALALVFCTLQGYRGMVEYNRELAQQVLSLYNTVLRRSLLATGGYECHEQQGSYKIAFHSSTDALEWCLMVQEIIYKVLWTEAMVALPNMLRASQGYLFSGPCVNMGVYTGVPTKVTPHSTTGRADYFGPLVNKAERLCHGAAHGGQVMTHYTTGRADYFGPLVNKADRLCHGAASGGQSIRQKDCAMELHTVVK